MEHKALRTLLANLRYAVRNGMECHIGGGIFTPQEIDQALGELGRVGGACLMADATIHRLASGPAKLASVQGTLGLLAESMEALQ